MNLSDTARNRDSEIAAQRYDVVVLPDVIDAADETRAREIFVQTLIDEPGLIRVAPHIEQEADVDA